MMYRIVIFYIILKHISSQAADTRVDYTALVDPCRDEDRLCPAACKISQLTGTYTCNFCYCNNPNDTLNWETTTPITTRAPTTTPAPSVAPGHLLVSGIEYVELKHACIPTEGLCPITCKMANVTRNGRTCETCECPVNIRDQFGKRNLKKYDESNSVEVIREDVRKRCMPLFACPIFNCPKGQKFSTGLHGCRECRCVDETLPTIPGAHMNPTLSPIGNTPLSPIDFHKHFINTYCTDPNYCPSNCMVVNYRVGVWTCHHCSCRNGQRYVALTNPCQAVGQSNVCSLDCKIRYLDDPKDPSSQCDYCDCSTESTGTTMLSKIPFAMPNSRTYGMMSAIVRKLSRRFLTMQNGNNQNQGQLNQMQYFSAQSNPMRNPMQHSPMNQNPLSSKQVNNNQHPGCAPLSLSCQQFCQYGYITNEFGCEICRCKYGAITTPSTGTGAPGKITFPIPTFPQKVTTVPSQLLITKKISGKVTSTHPPVSTQSRNSPGCKKSSKECPHNCKVTVSIRNNYTCFLCHCIRNGYTSAAELHFNSSHHCLDSRSDCPNDCHHMFASCHVCKCNNGGYFSKQDVTWHHGNLFNQSNIVTHIYTTGIISTSKATNPGSISSAQPNIQGISTTAKPISTKTLATKYTAAAKYTASLLPPVNTLKTTTTPTTVTPLLNVISTNIIHITSKDTSVNPVTISHQMSSSLTTKSSVNPITMSSQTSSDMVNSSGSGATKNSCYTCSEFKCKHKDITTCLTGGDYCMNVIAQDNIGNRNFTRRCATEHECYNKWWKGSRTQTDCLNMQNEAKGQTKQPNICTFCCEGSGCNENIRIPDTLLYIGDATTTGSVKSNPTTKVYTSPPFIIGKRGIGK